MQTKQSHPAAHTPKHEDPTPVAPKPQDKPAVSHEFKATEDSQARHTESVNRPNLDNVQHPPTNETPAHLAAQQHAPYPEKPVVQHINEQLTNSSPTGYAPHDPNLDLDKAQLATAKPSHTDSYNELKQRVDNEKHDANAK